MDPLALLPVAGLSMGLVASPHCLGMCGGLASALDRLGPADASLRGARLHLLYFTGRAASYAGIGALAGGSGLLVVDALGLEAGRLSRIGIGLMLLFVAGALAGLAPLRGLERLGRRVWEGLRPVSRRLSAMPPMLRALALGTLWGWLPCGMVYAAAASATLSGGALHGAVFMLFFALGTLPAVALAGMGASRLAAGLQARGLRQATAALLALGGLWTLLAVPVVSSLGHSNHASHTEGPAHADSHGNDG